MAGMAVSLLALVAAVKLWPVPGDAAPTDLVYTTRGPETIQFEEIVQTRQQRQTPPPPAPLPPIIVPDDRVIDEEFELDITDSFLPVDNPGLDQRLTPGDPIGAQPTSARAEIGPKPVRIVEPEYTRDAKRKKIRAEVVVEVMIDEKGRVQDSKIVERFLLGDDDDPKQPVDQLGYGLEEAAVSAAERWLFRPARQNGTPVRSQHELTFKFGV
jgi:protein TonB